MGRMTRDPDIKYTSGEKPMCVAHFTVAVDRSGKKDEADFIQCTAFGKTAEILEKYFHKGKPICLSGHIQTGSYDNNGTKVYTWAVIVDRLEFVPQDKREDAGSAEAAPGPYDNTPSGFERLTDDDIPF